jgi:hypothetical protein
MSGVFFRISEILYGALVPGAFVEAAAGGVGVVSELELQPVITALKARPNSTTKDNFFIGRRTLDWFP